MEESMLVNGQGKYTFKDGFGCEGEWRNGNENGIGNLTYPNGDKYIGQFKNGKMINGKMYKKNGGIHTQKNGNWIIDKLIKQTPPKITPSQKLTSTTLSPTHIVFQTD